MPKHLKRYREIARLLIKYGRADLVRQSGLREAVEEEAAAADGRAVASSRELAADLESLGATFVKLGQFLSTRPDLLPKPYLDALARLQDHVEPVAFDELEQIATAELGMPLFCAFAWFCPEPLASASLGQVHRATLRDGREVVVKVQRPGVRKQVVEDLDALYELAAVIDRHTGTGRRYQFHRVVELLRKTLMRELDYRHEAGNLAQLRRNMKHFRDLIVPQSFDDLTTSRILTMKFIQGRKITEVDSEEMPERRRQQLAITLFRAYLHQVLVDGLFHADPHPGNLCLTPAHSIAIFDLGMGVRIPPRLQEEMVMLMLAIAQGKGEQAADTSIKISRPRKDFDRAEFHDRITRLVSDHRDQSLDRMPLGRIVLEIQRIAAETGTLLPEEVLMLSKTLLHLEESLGVLDPRLELTSAIRAYASQVWRERARSAVSLPGAYQSIIEINEFVNRLPHRINQIMDLLATNQMSVRVDAIDERQLIRGIQKVANRITVGLLLAALIIGASLMMTIDTTFTILGYPAISLFFFLTAAGGALGLIVQILLKDRMR